ncbi:MAG: TlpA disulfide reductase family protein [Bergeyella zoohelcum]|nr:TlpA disulfide reductase family protein [Bergeyella zoohelcum]
MNKKYLYIAILIIVAGVFAVPSFRQLLFTSAEVKSVESISDANYDIELKGINVPNANLKDFKGKKLLFLNFWGTWCPPCKQEWPSIQRLYESKQGKMEFVLIAMQDEEEKVRGFLERNQFTAPVYIAQSPIEESLLPKVFPTTFILDKDGNVLMKEEGLKDWQAKSVLDFIEEQLKK